MHPHLRTFSSPFISRHEISRRWIRLPLAALLLAAIGLVAPALSAQIANRVPLSIDTSQLQALPNHHPLWANAANDTGLAPANLPLNQLTLVLSRSPQQQAAFDQFVADQQNPASPDYHRWLTPEEVGQRFGLSDQDISTISGWLQSQGLKVNWVSPSRIFIGFGGTAADVGRAFQTEMHSYSVRGAQRLSVNSDPQIPAAILPAVKAIRGLYAIDEQPTNRFDVVQSASPQMNSSSGKHYMGPLDFDTIYDVPLNFEGYGVTIGIVGWSRTNFADFDNFRQKTVVYFPNPTEVVPTAYGGVDPGPALTAPPSGSSSTLGAQGEATLDVFRAGSVAPSANLLLVVTNPTNGGIEADAQYLVNTSPIPAQIMTISFGACESSAGPSGVNFWDNLFQTAAAEGISVFVSSGDSGASGCDVSFAAPPATPAANSPNYICSSSYATCVGGTEFADTTTPGAYWNSTNDFTYTSALGYIPEGAWNESTSSSVAATGGGVSKVIATPSWQTGTGVPSPGTGRYTPDVSFSASAHDGYFACFAAAGYSCVSSGGSFSFVAFSGTSAAAPAMAGVAALLEYKLGAPQGNLNPGIYSLAAATPSAFHDANIASSGVTSCDINTPSMCNNGIPGASGSAAQAGFLLQPGYDEATGLGSLDVNVFLNNYSTPKTTPTVSVSLSSSSITTAQPLTVTVTVSGNSYITPMGTMTLSSGTYSFTNSTFSGTESITIAAASLAAGTDTLTASFTPQGSPFYYNSASGSATVTVTSVPKITPAIALNLSASNITSAQPLSVTVSVDGGTGNQTPTGTVTLTGTGYSSGPTALAKGSATFNILASSLPAGADTLTASYTPDAASSSIYNAASGSNSVTVTTVPQITPTVTVTPPSPSITAGQYFGIFVVVDGGAGNQPPTGTVKLTVGSFNTGGYLNNGSALLILGPGSLPPGNDTLAVTYTPDSASSAIYNTASGSNTLTVTMLTTVVTVTPVTPSITTTQGATILISASVTGNNPVATGTIVLTSGTYSSPATHIQGGTSVDIPAGALVVGTDTLTANYTPDSSSSNIYNPASGSGTITVNKGTPPITWNTPASVVVGTALSSTQLNAKASVPGIFAYTPPLGTVMSTVGSTTLSATFTPNDTASYTTATASVNLTVAPAFTISGTAVTLTAGATTGNTSTITVTPAYGFTGSVALTASITGPAGGQYPPTLSFGATSPVSITSAAAGTATLTISTTASRQSCSASIQTPTGLPWYARDGAVLACLLLFGIVPRRRRWRDMVGMLLLFAALAGGVFACGGGGGGTTCNNVVTPGTTAESYTFTVTGTSGPLTATSAAITLTVQ